MRHIASLFFLVFLTVPLRSQAQACTGLCLQQVSCPNGGTTTIRGTVYAPNGTDPLPNVIVFIPNAIPAAFPQGIDCPAPGTPPSGSPLVGTTTAADGTFQLTNVPVGTNIPLVIQSGRWRRQLTVPATTACDNTAFSGRMPKNKSEGDIPQIAIASGSLDSVECVLRKVGIENAEFTDPFSTGRIHVYSGTRSHGALIDANTPSQSTLMNDPAQLAKYDLLMLPCQGGIDNQTSTASLANLRAYANSGGRIYASHFSYTWFYQNAEFTKVANWVTPSTALADGVATINTSFPRGKALSDWLQLVGATTTPGQIGVQAVKKDTNGVNPPSQIWLTLDNASAGNPVQQFTWDTPLTGTNQCGRVLFNEYHVESSNSSTASKAIFPAECSDAPMTSQEKLLEYSLFDLTNTGSAPSLTPTSMDFGSVPVGFKSASHTFTWTNNSIFPVTVSSATVSSDFAVTANTCLNVAMPSGTSCQISALFQPTQIGPANGTLTVVSTANTLTANLTGNGISAVSVSASSLGFPNTDVGATSYQTLLVTNIAPGSISILLNVVGDYANTSNCPASLPPGASCTVKIGFTPTTTGSRPGTVTVNGNVVTLLGTGVDFSVAFNPSSGTAIAGTGLTVGMAILPISGFSSSVAVTCTTNAPASTCTLAAQNLVPSASAQQTIKITTTAQYAVIGYQGFGKGFLILLSMATGGLLALTKIRTNGLRTVLTLIVLLAASGLISGCSGKLPAENSTYTPAGSYTYTVTATDGFLSHFVLQYLCPIMHILYSEALTANILAIPSTDRRLDALQYRSATIPVQPACRSFKQFLVSFIILT